MAQGTYPSNAADQLEYWQSMIDWTRRHYEPIFRASQKLIDLYNMQSVTNREAAQEDINVLEGPAARVKSNLVFGWVEQSIANIAAQNPHFRTVATNRRGIGADRSVSAVSNYWYRETGQLMHDRRVLLDSFLCPYGGSKIGWFSEIENEAYNLAIASDGSLVFDDPEQETLAILGGQSPAILPGQDHELYIASHTLALQDPFLDPNLGILLEFNITERQRLINRGDPSHSTTIKRDAPFGERWFPGDLLIDPLAQHGLADARFVLFRWQRAIDEVLSNRTLNTRGLEPNATLDTQSGKGARTNFFGEAVHPWPEQLEMVEGYEIWARNFPVNTNKRRNLLLNVVPGHDTFLRNDDEWPLRLEDYPAEVLSMQSSVQTWYNKPTLQLAGADSTQTLMNEALDAILYVMRRQKNIIFYDPNMIEEDDIQSILQAPDMSAFPVQGMADNNRPVVPLEFGSTQPEKGQLIQIAQNLMDRSAGTPQPIAAPQSDTATEAGIVDRRNTAREDERAQKFSEFQVRKAKKFWQLTTQFQPDRIFLVNPGASEEMGRFSNITQDMVEGEYNFYMEISSIAQNRSLERKQWSDLLNLFTGLTQIFQQLYGQPPNVDYIAEQLLRRGYNIQDPERIMPWIGLKEPQNVPDELLNVLNGGAQTQAQQQGSEQANFAQPGLAGSGTPTVSNQNGAAQRTDQLAAQGAGQ